MNTHYKYKNHLFALVLQGIEHITGEFENAVFESGCDDAVLYSKNGIVYLEFDRSAKTLKDAIISAIVDVEKIPGIRVIVVEPADFVTVAEIARRADRTREYIRKLINGERGPGNFPKPLSGSLAKTFIYSWVEVSTWLTNNQLITDNTIHRIALIIRRLNDTLDIRHNPSRGEIPLQLLEQLNTKHIHNI